MGYWKELMTDRLTELIYHCLAMGYWKELMSGQSVTELIYQLPSYGILERTDDGQTFTELIYHCLAMGYWKELMTDSPSLN